MSLETQLRVRSEGIAGHLLAKKLATQADVDACGIAEASDDPETALIVRYGDLRVLLAERIPDADQRADRRKQADRIILDALRGASKTVRLASPDSELREVNVYPKSLNALIELAERDSVIGFMNSGLEAVGQAFRENPTLDYSSQMERAVREIVYQEQMCVWIVTHSAPGLPFPEDTSRPDPPAWLKDLSPVDVLLIFSAHEEVNAGRLAALQALPRGKRKHDDIERGWGVFLAGMASEARSAEQLARDHSLATLFAQNYVQAVEHERAMAEAEK